MPEQKQGKSHKLIRSAKHRAAGKGILQERRTAANKKKHIEMNKRQGDPLAGVSRPAGGRYVKKGKGQK